MAEVYFYHLTSSPLEQALPELLERVLSRDWRALVRGADKGRLKWLDDRLWLWRDEGFLPHGQTGGEHDSNQPVLLTAAVENRNLADVLLLIDGAKTDAAEVAEFTRVCLMFDGNNTDAVDAARGDWKTLTDAGIAAQYWAQDDGRWVKKSEKPAT
ncbi:MAG: DNA polymerase III subunit chi [Rhodobacteraceae bacterium]|nr:DNA polymerase III subunit chi [Paracoccaceae bacterium]